MLIRGSTYDLKQYSKRLSADWIERSRWMPCAAWKFLGSNVIGSVSVLHDPERFEKDYSDDYHVVKVLHQVLSEADILVAHNGDQFDIKEFNKRALLNGLPPLKPLRTYDTLKVARKYFRFESNQLRFLCKELGIEEKGESPDWDKICYGDPEEIAVCASYNRQDIRALEALYLKLRAWDQNHPSIAPYLGGIKHLVCRCGSDDLVKNGNRYTQSGKYQSYMCNSCGAFTADKKNMVKK